MGIYSALTLLMTWVGADHHDAAFAFDHTAIVADLFNTRADLHGFPFFLYLTCIGT